MEPVSEEILGCFLDIPENMENDAKESHDNMSEKEKKPKENIKVQWETSDLCSNLYLVKTLMKAKALTK